MKKILTVLADGFEETEAIAVVDVLKRAGLQVCLAGLDSTAVRGAHDIVISADALLEDVKTENFDAVFVRQTSVKAEHIEEFFCPWLLEDKKSDTCHKVLEMEEHNFEFRFNNNI